MLQGWLRAGGHPDREGDFRLHLAVVLSVAVVCIWVLETLPGQDLPQHLAYARIFMDYADGRTPFRDFYALPDRPQSYHLAYHLLAQLGRLLGLDAAAKMVFIAYVLALAFALESLRRAAMGGGAAPPGAAGVLAGILAWNPVMALGFLEFLLAMPIFIYVVSQLVRLGQKPRGRWDMARMVAAVVALSSMHLAAAGFAVLFAVVWALCSPSWIRAEAAAMALVCCWLTMRVWGAFAESGLGALPDIDLAEAVKGAHGIEFLNQVFGITWYDPLVKLNGLMAVVLGPYRLGTQLLLAPLWLAVLALRSSRPQPSREDSGARAFRRAALAFMVTALVVPWGMERPTELTFIDLRVMSLAFMLLLVAFLPRIVQAPGGMAAVGSRALLYTLQHHSAASAFGVEASAVRGVMSRAAPGATMMPLVFGGRSRYFGKQFHMTHFLPMYYTVNASGISTQFWARYTDHLPIDYRPGRRLTAPPDWIPEEFAPAHARSTRYFLLERVSDDYPAAVWAQSQRVEALLAQTATKIICGGPWCLYERKCTSNR
jgi:hypothetical protein